MTNSEPDFAHIFTSVEFSDAYKLSYLTNSIVVPAYESIKQDFGIIRSEYLLLLCLAHYPMLTAQHVANITRMPRNSISRGVHRMLSIGYLERVQDPEDGRKSQLTITDEGRRMHKAIAAFLVNRQEKVMAPLTLEERKMLNVLLLKLARNTITLDD